MGGYRIPVGAPAEMGRPLWGFCRIRVKAICQIWAAYQEGLLETADLRTWFAAHELVTRRCDLRKGRVPRYTLAELASISSIRPSRLKGSVGRLARLGFLAWSATRVQPLGGAEATVEALKSISSMLAFVTNADRVVPVPRHTVLLLARCRRPVLVATILGQLIRCVYYRARTCASWGRCKASWIASTFGVDVRNVKAARGELMRLGWMRQLDSNHWQRQRYGAVFVVSLQWDSREDQRPRSNPISPPRGTTIRPKSPPPDFYRNLPDGIQHQNRGGSRGTGVQGQKIGEAKAGKPQLRHIVVADLTSASRTAGLFGEAVRTGLVADTQAERLRFFAAAERAKRLAQNPGGFFLSIVRKRLWHHISDQDEEPARRALCELPEFYYGLASRPTRRGPREVT